MNEILQTVYAYLATHGLKIVAAVAIFTVGRWVARRLSRLARNAAARRKVDETLTRFVENLTYVALLIFVIRPWIKVGDYWPAYFDLTRQIKLALDENSISIPYPQRDIHVKDGLLVGTAGEVAAAHK